MRRSPLNPVLSLLALATLLASAACGGGTSSERNPITPTPSSSAGRAPGNVKMPGMGNMGGMAVQVTSEFDYFAGMIPHHEEAIATATLLQRGTDRQEMRDFAAAIIRTQSAEVEQMQAWLAAWYPGRDTRVAYTPMMRDLRGLDARALDQVFLEDMIPHHMMAVMMSQQLIARGLATRAEVVPFAQNISDVQRQEIQMMAVWLREWFGATVGGMGGH
jgi:uncharacterized protein (DUF305 family)